MRSTGSDRPSRFVGVDGCRSGWVAVTLDDEGRAAVSLLARIDGIIALGARRAMIDMPIGLPESGYRACDLAARKLLGAACSRVFLGARRPLLRFEDYAAANAWAKADGKGLSRQCWHILPKIAELDRFITPARQASVLEAHPELVFQRLDGGRALPPKRTAEGLRRRRDLLAAHGFDALDAWAASLRRRDAGPDDLYDACALALAAYAPCDTVGSGGDAIDARGLRMEIWY
jgi:predicted RNase H-like nuclease